MCREKGIVEKYVCKIIVKTEHWKKEISAASNIKDTDIVVEIDENLSYMSHVGVLHYTDGDMEPAFLEVTDNKFSFGVY